MPIDAIASHVRCFVALVAVVLVLPSVDVRAQTLPVARLFSIFPAGGKQATTVDVTITTSRTSREFPSFISPSLRVTAVQRIGSCGAWRKRSAGCAGAIHDYSTR